MKDYLGLIDIHTQGRRNDVTPLFADPVAFSELVTDLAAPFDPAGIDLVAGIDALGFILATAIAIRLGKGLIPIRKGGKLPVQVDKVEFIDYSGQLKLLEMRSGSLQPGTRVLLVDEWIETGAQAKAAIELIEHQGGIVAGIAAINIDINNNTIALLEKYRCHTVWSE
jgi:adenine phosphoribosyltransferase